MPGSHELSDAHDLSEVDCLEFLSELGSQLARQSEEYGSYRRW